MQVVLRSCVFFLLLSLGVGQTAFAAEAGFRSLFDGKTTAGWRGFKKESFPATGWAVQEGALGKKKGEKGGGDVVTVDEFDNFDFRFEFKLTPGANSGVKYLVDEAMVKNGSSGLGFEYQVLDDVGHPDAKAGLNGNRTCAGLYDLIAPETTKTTRPVGAWNEGRIVVQGGHIEHWLNGKKTVAFERSSPAMKALIAGSKYKDKVGFGDVVKGHILLQDHGDEVAFRNMRIRIIGAGAQKPAPKTK